MHPSVRSKRLQSSLMSCSTTPRTTRKYLEELQTEMNRNEVIYNEVKEAMAMSDIETATTLMNLLPSNYRNVDKYRAQCLTYDSLCKDGIVERECIMEVRARLADILKEAKASQEVTRYADALVRHGYNVHAVDRCTMADMEDAMSCAKMSEGHRQLFAAFAEKNTPVGFKGWMDFLHSLQKCAPLLACVQDTTQKVGKRATVTSSAGEVSTEEKRCKKLDETENPEVTLVRWKTTETVLGMATGAGGDGNDDDDETAGDED